MNRTGDGLGARGGGGPVPGKFAALPGRLLCVSALAFLAFLAFVACPQLSSRLFHSK